MIQGPPDRQVDKPVFLTGATGYIGGRLAPRLIESGRSIRCLSRNARKARAREWSHLPGVEIVEGDVTDTDALAELMKGCGASYYLVHSMLAAGASYRQRDRDAALNFAVAAERAGLERIVYLGGLGETGDGLSEHLRSRREVEEALKSGATPVTVLRAAMIIGSGSASFEILRYLVERLPVMVTPRWVRTECQPIAIRNVLSYLVNCLSNDETVGRTLDIGGPDVVTYRQLLDILAEARGLRKRLVIPVPVLTPRLSAGWIHLVTPLSHRIAIPLAEGLRNRVVCRNDEAHRLMPQRLLTVRESIDAALGQLDRGAIETSWSGAGVIPGDPDWAGGAIFTDQRSIHVDASADDVHAAVCRVGGGHGYYAADWLWRVRGVMDRLIGGPGLRRGRRNAESVSYGDALDFWRVVGVEPGRRLLLRAEMKLPGEAELEFAIEPDDPKNSGCTLTQTARFKPKGLLGLIYWWAVYPLHGVVFSGMLRGIRRAAETHSHTEPAIRGNPS